MHLSSALAAVLILSSACSPTLAVPAQERSLHYDKRASTAAVGYDYLSVTRQGAARAKYSWEWGTMAQTLLEVFDPSLSVFGTSSTSFPKAAIPAKSASSVTALSYVKPHINTSSTSQTLTPDGAAGDPASMGVSAIMIGMTEPAFKSAAARQANHLLRTVPRYSNGAISHRESVAALWADFTYMAPPFLAYYAVATNNKTLLKYTVDEIGRQRQILRFGGTTSYKGLWTHIIGPEAQSKGIWSTGNAWAVLGMVRVLATMHNWSNTSFWTQYPGTLKTYIYEILDGVLEASTAGKMEASSGLVRNYIVGGANGYTDTSFTWFGDAAGTAGLAAAVYRMAVLDPSGAKKYLSWANAARKAVAKTVGPDFVIRPTVNPYDWYDRTPYTAGSPEAQAFAGMLGAAYVSCLDAKVCT